MDYFCRNMSRRIYIQGDQPLCSRLPLHFVSTPVFHFLVHIEVALCATTLGNDTRPVCNAGTTIGNNGNNFRRSSDIPPGKTSECLFVCLLEYLLCFHCEDTDNIRHGFGNSYSPNLVSRPTRRRVSEKNEMVVVQNAQLNTRVRMCLRVCVHVNVSNNFVLMLTHVVSLSKKAQKVQADSGCKGIQGNTSKAELKCVCLNARSIINKKNELDIMVDEIKPHIIGITESWANNDITDAELGLEGYVMFRKDRMGKRGGGVLLYIKETIPAYEVQLHEEADCNEAIWCKLVTGHTTVTIGVVYRCPNITKENNDKIHNAISEVSKGDCIIMGDFNHGNIKWDTLQSTGIEDQKFLCLVQDNFLTQHVLEPTRATRILDIVLSSQKELVDNVEIKEPLGSSDHNQMYFNINVKSDKTKVKQCRRDFRKGNYKEIRKRLTLIDWNNKMKNKTAAECWNIVRGELDNAIDSYVPMKKEGKRSKKKHLSKEAFRKIRYKQKMWRVYKHTGKDTDYDAYKEALNAATNEVRKSKRNFEHKLAQNIKSDSKSFYAYVRSKQNVRDKVGPLKDTAGNIITQGFLMAEELNMHFSSVFTRENTSSLPVPETKFNGSEGEKLGQLVVTPEVVASKINNMKENKSPGVDGISPKILKEIVEQISMPLAHVFNMSLQEGIVPLEWKEANIIPLFKKGSRNKSVNYRPVSLTSVICKLLETIIRDHMMDFLLKHR